LPFLCRKQSVGYEVKSPFLPSFSTQKPRKFIYDYFGAVENLIINVEVDRRPYAEVDISSIEIKCLMDSGRVASQFWQLVQKN
jgi:hypothetical protein